MPVTTRAAVWMDIRSPSGATTSATLALGEDAVFRGSLATQGAGVYEVRLRVRGTTLHGTPFSREQVLSAAALAPGSRPDRDAEIEQDARDERLCRLLECLASNAKLEQLGLDPGVVKKCLAEYCRRLRRTPTERPAPTRAPTAPTVRPMIAKVEEGTPRIARGMIMDEHDMTGPMFGLSPQDLADARKSGVGVKPPGPAAKQSAASSDRKTQGPPAFGLSPQDLAAGGKPRQGSTSNKLRSGAKPARKSKRRKP